MSENKLSLTDWIPPCIVEGQKKLDHDLKIMRWLMRGLLAWIIFYISAMVLVISFIIR